MIRFGVAGKLVLAAVLVEVVALSLLVWNSQRLMDERLREQAQLRLEQVAATVRPALAASIVQGNLAATRELVTETSRSAGLSRLYVIDIGGQVLADSGPAAGKPGNDALRIETPLELAGVSYGRAALTLSDSFLQEARASLFFQSALIAVLELLASSAALALLGFWIARRMGALSQVTAAWARGEMSARARPVGNDEISRLGRRFNAMADVLEQRLAELRQSQARHAEAEQVAMIGHWEQGLAGRWDYWSDQTYRLLGYRPGEVKPGSEAFLARVHPEDLARVRQRVEADPLAVEGSALEYRVLLPTGGVRHLRNLTHLERGADGRPHALFGTVQDVTERVELERVRARSQAAYAMAAQIANLGHWEWQVGEDRIDWSDQTYRIFGYEPGAVQPTVELFLSHTHPEEREAVQRFLDAAVAEQEEFSIEYRVMRPDGQVADIEELGTVERDAAGRPRRVFGTVLDITERKRTQQQLDRLGRLYAVLSGFNQAVVREREAQPLFEQLCRVAVESGGFPLAWVGLADEATQTLTPVAECGAGGDFLHRDRLSLDPRDASFGMAATTVTSGRVTSCEDLQADERYAHWREPMQSSGVRSGAAVPIVRDGRVVGVFVAYSGEPGYFAPEVVQLLERLADDLAYAMASYEHDARRRAAEAGLQRLNSELEERVAARTRDLELANRELEAFSYSVSHDLRAPLRAIDGFSRFLGDRYRDQLDDRGRDYFDRIGRASQRMGAIIDDLLLLSRIGRHEVHARPVDLSTLADDVLAQLRQGDPQRQVEVSVQPGMRVDGDPQLLRVALDNLLGNAWKFTSQREAARIEVGQETRDGETVSFVRDNGAGFDPRYAHKLFAAFQRLHTDSEFPGTGIGLATVQRVVSRHGGRIWAEGEVERGATFYFVLPGRVAEEAAAGAVTAGAE